MVKKICFFLASMLLLLVNKTINAQPVSTVHENDTKKSDILSVLFKQEESEKIFKKMLASERQRDTDFFQKIDEEKTIEYFFETKVANCTQGICYGLIPIPVIYAQSKSSKMQFLMGATTSRFGFVVRYRF